ncbi:hypothetical protein AAVH_13375, partial [Aphelenchoides avenae]
MLPPLVFLLATAVAALSASVERNKEGPPEKGIVNCNTGMNNLCPFNNWNCNQYCKDTYGQHASGYCQGTYPYNN